MRIIFLCICLMMTTSAFGQKPHLNKLWVGDSNNYLYFFDSQKEVGVQMIYQNTLPSTYPNFRKMNISQSSYKYTLIGDTLRINERSSNDSSNYDYLIKALTKDELKLVKLNANNRILSITEIEKRNLTFKSQKRVYTDTIHFQKIIFSSTTCYGPCPAMTFEIDDKKQMKFIGDKYAIKQGFYKATLPNLLYKELQQAIAVSELDKFDKFGIMGLNIDLSTYTIEVHYNNKVRFLKFAFPPFIFNELLTVLHNMPKKVVLKEAEPFKISFSQ